MATKPTTKNKGGRPVGGNKPRDWELVDKLAGILCTEEEIASVCKCSRQTLINRCKKEHGCTFKEYLSEHQDSGRVSLRRLQWASAQGVEGVPLKGKDGKVIVDDKRRIQWETPSQAPSISMQIFLGKNILGQSDRQDMILDTSEKFAELLAELRKA